jgi:hypothetical protein
MQHEIDDLPENDDIDNESVEGGKLDGEEGVLAPTSPDRCLTRWKWIRRLVTQYPIKAFLLSTTSRFDSESIPCTGNKLVEIHVIPAAGCSLTLVQRAVKEEFTG